jgi:putative DNA methylase
VQPIDDLARPTLRAIDVGLPLGPLHDLSKVESYNKNLYRPSSYLHKWWAKRLGSVFRTITLGAFCPPSDNIWQRYYEGACFTDRVVLDPFMGGGTTIQEALRLGCKVVGVDYNPVAWWTVRSSISLPDLERLEEGFLELKDRASGLLLSQYETRCPKCDRGAYAAFILWVRKAKCERCSRMVRLHESFVLRTEGDLKIVVCPHCRHLFETRAKESAGCCECGHRLQLGRGVASDGQFTCPECSHVQRAPRGAKAARTDEQYEMFAVRYVCPRHGEGFKTPGPEDLRAYAAATERFMEARSSLSIPDELIPDGWKTGDLLAHDYVRWRDLFNTRQLFCAGTLLKEVMQIGDPRVRESFVTLFSACLEFNNLLCTYKGGSARRPGAVRHIFSHHAFVFPYEMLENNFWGVGSQSGTFAHLYSSRMRRAKEYCLLPREREVRHGRTVRIVSLPHEAIEGRLAKDFTELMTDRKNALLLCRSSESLPIPDRSVDAVITDPPYSDNVQYGELSDFFYVWQRLALQGTYREYEPALVLKEHEIVKNPAQGKDGSFYQEGLRKVFSECNRVLKDDGLLVFTFHHKAFEAWVNVLTAVLDAGFYITAAYPVHSEMPLSVHIHNYDSMSYDAILVCRKRGRHTGDSWTAIRSAIRRSAKGALEALGPSGKNLPALDAYVVVLGKCLQCYSAHYPDVYETSSGNHQVSIEQALREAQEIVAQVLGITGSSCLGGEVLRHQRKKSKKNGRRLTWDGSVRTCWGSGTWRRRRSSSFWIPPSP